MSLSGKLASKVKGFMTKGIEELYKKESSSLSKDFTVPKTTQQQMQEAQATTVTSVDQAPITPVDQLPITEIDESVLPDRPSLRRQVEDLGLSKEEADEVLIPDAIDINQMPEVWKAPYRKAQEQGYTVPLFHFTRAGEEIQFDPKGEGTG